MSTRRRKQPAAPEPPREKTFVQWQSELTDRERRVEDIVHKMQSGSWLSGVSERALAEQWDITPNAVRAIASEASRVIRRRLRDDPTAKAEARAQIMQTFEVIRAKAMAKGDPASLRVALDATRALGFYQGVEPVRRLDVVERHDPFEGWTTEEKLAFANEGRKPRRALAAMAAANGTGDGAQDDADGSVH